MAEVLDVNFQEWRMVSSMANKRRYVGVGVINNLLYAVGGYDSSTRERLNSVECYDPSLDTWKLVAPMFKRRSHPSIAVLDGVMYAVGGLDGSGCLTSVEDGLLYLLGHSKDMMTVQIYNPNTNTWKLMKTCLNGASLINAAVVFDRPLHFTTQ